MQKTLKLYQSLTHLPLGKIIFSKMLCFLTPYFSSIKPSIKELKINRCVVFMKKRRAVTNHLKTVHAVAMCNMAELAGGLMTEVSLPQGKRWIPSGMTVKYLKKAKSNLIAIADGNELDWDREGEVIVPVGITDDNNELFEQHLQLLLFTLFRPLW
jgi:acyl-coenzyme A thioesterase PaaI-like protein